MKNKILVLNNDFFSDCINKVKSDDLIINLQISLEKDFYEGSNLYLFINKINECKNKIQETKRVKKIQLDVGDILNRHTWYYKYCEQYMLKNGIVDENLIPEKTKKKFQDKAYLRGEEQGRKWFKDNINAINELIPENNRLKKNFKLGSEITTLYEGDAKNPTVEYICYDYWLNHPKYKSVEQTLKSVCNLENSIIKRAYNNSVDYYQKRIEKKVENINFISFFKRQSYNYLFDENVATCILYSELENVIEFYFGGREPNGTQVFRGKKAQSDPIIQKYLQGPLKGADQRKFVSVKMVEE